MGFPRKITLNYLLHPVPLSEIYRTKDNTFKYLTDVYTCLIPWVNVKYSQERSYACQGGSMLRNISPGTAGTMSPK